MFHRSRPPASGARADPTLPGLDQKLPQLLPADIDAITNSRGRATITFAKDDQVDVLAYPPSEARPYLGVRVPANCASTPGSQGQLVTVKLRRGQSG